jgi:dATP pyrophosphohydrolase
MPLVRADIVALYPYRPGASAAGEHGVEFLLMRRAPRKYMPGTWNVVQGKIEPGETAIQAAVREMQEETGLRPRTLYQMNGVNTYFMAPKDTLVHSPVFLAEVGPKDEVTLNNEHDDYRWLKTDDALTLLIWPNQRKLIRALVSDIIEAGDDRDYLRLPEELWDRR